MSSTRAAATAPVRTSFRAQSAAHLDFGFTNELLYKDVKLCLDEGEALGVPWWWETRRPALGVAKRVRVGRRHHTIVRCVEEWAGVEVKK